MPAGLHRDHRTTARRLGGSGSSHPRTRPHRGGHLVPLLCGLSLLAACARAPELGEPLAGLTKEQRAQFERGRTTFAEEFCTETGLGPLFNATSCAECHESPVMGGVGDEIELHMTAFSPGEEPVCNPLIEQGGPVIQQDATAALRVALGIKKEPEPSKATGRGRRTAPDLFGFGLLDAVPEQTIVALADPDDRNRDGISGRANRTPDGRVGRFGRKAAVASLHEFNDGAYLFEQGITSPTFPSEDSVGGKPVPEGVDPVEEPEITQETLDATDAFVRFLAPPAPKPLDAEGKRGRQLFTEIGCAACHVPTLRTAADHPVIALRDKHVAAYTDLLLHDMGPDLADICLGLATPSEFRTEPLMGLRLSEEKRR
jgi:CxxC motif-containing protein (DUF1111 family)